MRTLLLAPPRGFCAGVIRVLDIVEPARERFDLPLDVRGEEVFFPFSPGLGIQKADERISSSQKP
jgi:4-hydroxy-3-methylbut-2-enyl diphosphate reductase IspH